MSKLVLLLFSISLVGKILGCRIEFNNRTLPRGYNLRYDYSRRRYTTPDEVVNNATIICANIYTTSEIYYTYKEETYEQFLKIVDSNITTLQPNELSKFTTVTKLYLSGIHIKSIMPGSFTGVSRLEEIYLDNNELTEVSKGVFNSLQRLQVLDLSRNKIYHVEKFALMGVSSLEKLYLQSNNLSKIDNDTFDKLTHLSYLDLSKNPLGKLPSVGFSNLETLLASETKLTEFGDLSKNKLTMKMLNLSLSHISEVDFALFPKVTVLDLSSNNISTVKNCHKLETIAVALKFNRIKTMCQGFNGLSQILLSHNQLESVNGSLFNNSRNLLYLDLSFNNISTLGVDVFNNMSALQALQLNNNNISKLDPGIFRKLSSLTYLNLSCNVIADLQYGTFNSLKELRSLDISHNKIFDLHPYIFYALSNLQKLYFDYNNVSSFDVRDLTSHLGSLWFISLDGNPWKCKQLIAMSHALKNMTITIAEGDAYDVENFKGIACQNDKKTALDPDTVVKNVYNELRNIVNDSVKASEMDRFFNQDFMNSSFVKFFNQTTFLKSEISEEKKSKPISTEVKTGEFEHESGNNTVLILSVILQIVMCCLLIFIIYLMLNFLKRQKPEYRMDRLSQVELC